MSEHPASPPHGTRKPAPPHPRDAWLAPAVAALLMTIPAFYLELRPEAPVLLAGALYVIAAAATWLALWRSGQLATRHTGLRHARWPHALLVAGLLISGLLPASSTSDAALGFRFVVAVGTLARMIWLLRHFLTRGSVTYLLATALSVLGLCGLGFWWLEPTTNSLGDGLWLAFTTAATVGFGDIVPTTPASKIFSVFVVLLGYGVLSIVTAAIAAKWVETLEQRVERDILTDLHRETKALRAEVQALSERIAAAEEERRPSEREPS